MVILEGWVFLMSEVPPVARMNANGADMNLVREAATGRTALHLAIRPEWS